jgi:hypothetical protein
MVFQKGRDHSVSGDIKDIGGNEGDEENGVGDEEDGVGFAARQSTRHQGSGLR